MSIREESKERAKRRFEERRASPGRERKRTERETDRRRRSRSRRKEDDALAIVRKSPSRSRSAPRKLASASVRNRSGFDQKEMLPENFAMMQLAAMKTPPPQISNQRMVGLPPANMVPNPEVELFLQHNPVEPHAATRLRSLPMELQTIVLQRGSLFGGRDPTAVLLGRIRSATSGLRGTPAAGMYGGGAAQYGQPPGGFSGTQLPPGGTGVIGMTPQSDPVKPDQHNSSHNSIAGDMAKQWSDMNRGDDRQHDSQSGGGSGSDKGSPWGPAPQQDDYDFGYGSDGSKSWYEARAEQEKKHSKNSIKNSGYYEVNTSKESQGDSRGSRIVDGKGDGKYDGKGDCKNGIANSMYQEFETSESLAMRGKMQSSLAELSASILGKNEAKLAGFIHERNVEVGGDEESFPSSSSGGVIPKRVSAKAPPLNPFRSKPRAAPVAVEPEPQPVEPPIDFNKFQPPKPPEPEPAQLQQQEQQLRQQIQQHQQLQQQQQQQQKEQEQQLQQQHQQQEQKQDQQWQAQDQPIAQYREQDQKGGDWNSSQNNHAQAYSTSNFDIPMPQQQQLALPDPPDLEPWTGEKLATLNVPPGIAVRLIRQKRIILTTNFLKQIEAFQAATVNAAIQDAPVAKKEESIQETTPNGVDEQMAAAAAAAEKMGAASNPDVKRAQALTTLGYYGLTDPSSSEDVAKAVQAVAVATGDQATAVALWHQVNGTEASGESPTSLTEEQQAEIQQAAASAQYSQYWLQQQFQSQLAMFENQRLMATGDNPVATVEDAKESALKGPRGDPAVRGARRQTNQPMLPGDWTCPGCGDHQFARNRVCRFCGASRPLGSH